MPELLGCCAGGRNGVTRFGTVTGGAALLLLGCPQLLANDFDLVVPENGSMSGPGTAPNPPTSDAGTARNDASAGSGGVAGSGGDSSAGSANGGGSGGGGSLSEPLAALRAALAHRYRFDGTGTSAVDDIAGADGTINATTLTGAGYVSLSGGAFVNLPNGLVSATDDRTLETWLVWNGGAAQQRIFDFGSSTGGEDGRGNGQSFFSLSPDVGYGVVSIAYSLTGISGLTFLNGETALGVGALTHLAVVVDSQSDRLALYVNGQLDASATMTTRLSLVNDINDWLGVSQIYTAPYLDAQIHEFRIYGAALSDELVALSFELGPDTSDLDE